jgi:alpha-L-fucosidase
LLFPSKYSTHTVRESAWKDGKGDVLKELSAACKEYGLKFGVYLSPWDRNHPKYGTPEYNQIFANTLKEVHTQYGPVFEQWFDGAKGANEKDQAMILSCLTV